ncbi:hypothetical protein [Pseudoxanthomonas indica]|uniref:Uncharacterized membrane protein n=1 Tax=Pseudoxanthomonas indica TaxID=428993 RepID=A0A1T5IMF2_9GAMM|nr:hypothetical protein [Pseudoxanthomonas indica]GGD53146.1 hypothetical protein GCM10007235_26720 [Pseudoxanthomonas indica]SKC40384.1 Uncharacterized membrane protein [Pseudoxanthomonas indica]
MSKLRAALFIALSLAYPLVVYLALGRFEPRWLALLLLALALLRAIATRQAVWLVAAAGAAVLALMATIFNQALPLKLYPALVNAVMLAVFAASLVFPPSVVERIARLTEPDLPAHAVVYTRRVTQVWCAFFIVNGTLALITALWASDRAWAIYNGGIAYVLMGSLFAIEWLVRQRVRAAHRHD